jgi:hypothetical protein
VKASPTPVLTSATERQVEQQGRRPVQSVQRAGVSELLRISVMAKFAEHSSVLKKSQSGWSADQERIQHCQTKAKTLRKSGI